MATIDNDRLAKAEQLYCSNRHMSFAQLRHELNLSFGEAKAYVDELMKTEVLKRTDDLDALEYIPKGERETPEQKIQKRVELSISQFKEEDKKLFLEIYPRLPLVMELSARRRLRRYENYYDILSKMKKLGLMSMDDEILSVCDDELCKRVYEELTEDSKTMKDFDDEIDELMEMSRLELNRLGLKQQMDETKRVLGMDKKVELNVVKRMASANHVDPTSTAIPSIKEIHAKLCSIMELSAIKNVIEIEVMTGDFPFKITLKKEKNRVVLTDSAVTINRMMMANGKFNNAITNCINYITGANGVYLLRKGNNDSITLVKEIYDGSTVAEAVQRYLICVVTLLNLHSILGNAE